MKFRTYRIPAAQPRPLNDDERVTRRMEIAQKAAQIAARGLMWQMSAPFYGLVAARTGGRPANDSIPPRR